MPQSRLYQRIDRGNIVAPKSSPVERRANMKAGTIEFDGGAVNCMVRNMTDLGAMLDVVSAIGIPDRFTLALQTDRLRKYCRTVWWNEKRIGVAFD